MLSDRVAVRLRRAGMKAAGVSLAIRDPDFRDISRQRRLEPPTCLARELSQAAVSLAEGCWNMDSPVRALTVTALYLISEDQAGVQLDLLGQGRRPQAGPPGTPGPDAGPDSAKYGRNAISPASSARRVPGRSAGGRRGRRNLLTRRNRCPASAKEAAAMRFPKESLDQLQQLTHIQAEVPAFRCHTGVLRQGIPSFVSWKAPFIKRGLVFHTHNTITFSSGGTGAGRRL